jgi:hypothetical protein
VNHDLEHDLDAFDAAALALLQRLISVPVTPGWSANWILGATAAIAEVREKVCLFRQYSREQHQRDKAAAALPAERRARQRNHS